MWGIILVWFYSVANAAMFPRGGDGMGGGGIPVTGAKALVESKPSHHTSGPCLGNRSEVSEIQNGCQGQSRTNFLKFYDWELQGLN